MAKKETVTKVSPSVAVRSMELYNEKVLMLMQQCEMALLHNMVNNIISGSMQDALNEVKEFHKD